MSQAIALTSWMCIFGSRDMWARSFAASPRVRSRRDRVRRPSCRATTGLLAFGPDTETAVSLLVALEDAAEAELRAAVLGD
jgi:hypothetical protein